MDTNKILENRIILLNGPINEKMANEIKIELLYLDSLNHDDIYLYIDSPGGDVLEGLAIIDCMNFIESDVNTICLGAAYSMAAIILSSGTIGKRKALLNSEIMIHEPSTEMQGKAKDIVNRSNRLLETSKQLSKIISTNTKKEFKKVYTDMKDDYFMNSKDAKRYGIIDKILFNQND